MDKIEDEDIIRDIAAADKLLIVAAAGLSISIDEPNNVYHSKSDFKTHYPQVARYGYSTAYEAMGLSRDESVPIEIRKAYTFRHFLNMRFNFKPTAGYTWLKELADTFPPGNTFVWTSNVDGCFERSGFDSSSVYTTQGEMNKLQCARLGCGNVWNCEEQMRAIDAASPNGVLTDLLLLPVCSMCGSTETLPNLRGGDWFIHSPYKDVSLRLMEWLDICTEVGQNVAIIEVGVGPNTPVVTRIPACSFANAVQAGGGSVVYLRVNPDKPEQGRNENPLPSVKFVRWRQSWTCLEPLVNRVVSIRRASQSTGDAFAQQVASSESAPVDMNKPLRNSQDVNDNDVHEEHRLRERNYWRDAYHRLLESLDTPRLR